MEQTNYRRELAYTREREGSIDLALCLIKFPIGGTALTIRMIPAKLIVAMLPKKMMVALSIRAATRFNLNGPFLGSGGVVRHAAYDTTDVCARR